MYVSLIQIIYLGCNLGSRLCNNLLIPFFISEEETRHETQYIKTDFI